MSTLAFSTLSLAPAWLENLEQLGYVAMTPIQALALPAMLEGRDVLGQAATGTGKTAAFGLALLSRITPRGERPGALVLCPTRELAAQVAEELRRLARPLPHTRVLTVSGGTSVQRERASLDAERGGFLAGALLADPEGAFWLASITRRRGGRLSPLTVGLRARPDLDRVAELIALPEP